MSDRDQANPFPGLFILAGVLVLLAGIWWISHPAAVIAAGLLLAIFGFIGRHRRGAF